MFFVQLDEIGICSHFKMLVVSVSIFFGLRTGFDLCLALKFFEKNLLSCWEKNENDNIPSIALQLNIG